MKSMENETQSAAEKNFRMAFERLKSGKTTRLPEGAQISQNNVAREAGYDPSALKKARFPTLVYEIQILTKSQNTYPHKKTDTLTWGERQKPCTKPSAN